MIRVLIADDHAVVRRGLREIISDHPDLHVAAEAASFTEVIERLRTGDPFDALLMDVSMPWGDILDTLYRLRARWPRLPVLLVSVHPEDEFALRMLRAGASGYLSKESAPDELVAALRTVVAGRKYVSATLAGQLAESLGGESSRPLHESLSDREFQVLLLIARGMTVSGIGVELHLSAKTVSTYRSRLLEKMGMSSNVELTRYAIKQGLA